MYGLLFLFNTAFNQPYFADQAGILLEMHTKTHAPK